MNLDVNHIKKQYREFQLDCSIQIPEGRIIGFVGPNGAGKSTTMKAILGLCSPDEGQILADGRVIEEWSKKEREKIGVVLADSGFSGYYTVSDVCRIMKKFYSSFHEEEFRKQCKHFQLPMQKQIKEFSTGMRAKLYLLLSMSYDAELLVLDEPTAGLDVISRNELLDRIRDYMEPGGRSILISSHISGDLEGLCDEIYLIYEGKILLHEDTDRLLDRYGVLKATEQQYEKIEKKYLIRKMKGTYEVDCLTDQIRYYRENYPDIITEKVSIDDIIMYMIRGDRV